MIILDADTSDLCVNIYSIILRVLVNELIDLKKVEIGQKNYL